MLMTLRNQFHRTKMNLEPVSTGTTIHDEKYAEFTEKQIKLASMTLCGVKNCTCHKFLTYCEDEDGEQYLVMMK